MKTTLESKFVGCLVGSAVGDSLGSSLEGLRISEDRLPRAMGRWTDDTHMMIGVAESLIENKGFDGDHMAQTFIRHYEQEPWRGYAPGPPKVFQWIRSGVVWHEAATRLFGGGGSFGNGAAMRVAPIGLLYHDDPEKLRSIARSQSQITHAHELGMEGAVLQAFAVGLATSVSSSSMLEVARFLERVADFTMNERYRQKLEKARELLEDAHRLRVVRELGNGVEALNSVPTAIYSFLCNPDNFEQAVLHAISLGGDTDTIGAMTGAISGAFHGIELIPEDWRNKLENGDYIAKLARELLYINRSQQT